MQVAGIIQTSINKKAVMAITGLMLVGFVIAHLMGNLLVFCGPDALNAYAKKLVDLGPLLWAARITLIVVVMLHVWSAVTLVLENRRARGQAYAVKKNVETTLAARTMALSGMILIVYIVYHLMHFTFKTTHPEFAHMTDALGRHDVYSMVVESFKDLYLVIVYVFSMFLLSMHLSHGMSSMFQSLGINNDLWVSRLRCAGRGIAALIFIGYSSIPVAIYVGWIQS